MPSTPDTAPSRKRLVLGLGHEGASFKWSPQSRALYLIPPPDPQAQRRLYPHLTPGHTPTTTAVASRKDPIRGLVVQDGRLSLALGTGAAPR